ncbi:MAG: hypothetical protein ABSA45_12340 [Verrucomicrobiota bacterium]|jgi:hypothetical protein
MILIVGAAVGIGILLIVIWAIYIGSKSIFPGSGVPISMAQTLLGSIHVSVQHLLGLSIIVILSILMAKDVVKSEAGMPLLSAVAGYLLGRGFSNARMVSPKSKKSQDQDTDGD